MCTPSHFSKPCIHAALAASLTLTCSVLISCGNSSSASTATTEPSLAKKSLDRITSLWPSRIPIAEVRNKDLKKMTSGADRALAWDRSLNQWVYMPVHYKPATLPDDQTLPISNGLLPPLHPGQPSTLKGQGNLPLE